jgi:transposase
MAIKFANSPPCACRGSSGHKPQYGLMTLAYQVYYLQILKRLREKVRRKRTEHFANNSILHHDNAPAHTALSVREFLTSKQVTVLEHPSYLPDLAPNELFCSRK